MTRLIGLYGTGGSARGLMPILRQMHGGSGSGLVFIDDAAEPNMQVNGHAVMQWSDFLAVDVAERAVCLGIAAPAVRARLAQKCDDAGVPLASVKAENVVEMDDVIIGDGACISPFVTFTSNIRIGRAFHANLYSYVEHDCVVGDFVTFAPGAKCNGNVHIGDGAYIGSGAVIKQGTSDKPLRIGRGAFIGMGAVITRDVPDGTTVVGNPARPIKNN